MFFDMKPVVSPFCGLDLFYGGHQEMVNNTKGYYLVVDE